MQFVNCPNMDTLLSRWDDALHKSTTFPTFPHYTAEQAGALAIPIQMPSRNGNHIKSLLRFSQLQKEP